MKIITVEKLERILKELKRDCIYAEFIGVVDTPNGCMQESELSGFKYEYVDQKTGCSCDDYYGTICLPFGIFRKKYLKLSYSM